MKSALLLLVLLFTNPGISAARTDTPLFSDHSVLELSIPLNFKTLCRPRESEECDYIPTILIYDDPKLGNGSIPAEVIIRGGWRSLARNCSAPLLFIRFKAVNTPGTPFEGQSVLPLTTHCGQGISLEAISNRQPLSTWEQYLLREYLAYRLYNMVSESSLNARLVRISYPNPDKPGRSINNFAFFTEHFDALAKRNQARRLARGNFDATKLDGQSAMELALFQYMIGNTDWSIVRERNTIVLQSTDGMQVSVPFDFDMSGLVNAHYAGPAPSLPIKSVRDRYFLGYCHPDTHWDLLFADYLQKKEAMLSATMDTPRLDNKSKRSINRFLKQFFAILESPEQRDAEIVSHCQGWPPDPEDHMSPFAK